MQFCHHVFHYPPSFWIGKITLHMMYCVPKLHFHHVATNEGYVDHCL